MSSAAVSTVVLLLGVGISAATGAVEPPAAARASEISDIVTQDCGSCHGLTLKGGLGPALLPATLADKPAAALRATILSGRPGTAMPPWRPFFTDAEVGWIVEQLQTGGFL